MDSAIKHPEQLIEKGLNQPEGQELSQDIEALILAALFRERVTRQLATKLRLPLEDASNRLEALWTSCLAYFISRLPATTRGDIKRPDSFSSVLSMATHPPESAGVSHSEVLLLVLKPSQDPSYIISCQLCKANLASTPPPRYGVLSYDWGSPSSTKHIELNGSFIEVADSLESALRYLRDRSKPRVFWVDPLCIDSGNGQLLGSTKGGLYVDHIFTRAQELIIWLGDKSDTSTLAFQYLKAFPDFTVEEQRGLSQKEPQKLHLGQSLEAIKELLNRPWWDRAGLLVKYMDGRRATVVCGNDSANWTSFKRLFDVMKEKEPMIRKRHAQYLTTIAHVVYILPCETAEDLTSEQIPNKESHPQMEMVFSAIISIFERLLKGPKPGVNWVLALFKVAWHLGPVLTHLAIKMCNRSLSGRENIHSVPEKVHGSSQTQSSFDQGSLLVEAETFKTELQCWLRVLKALSGRTNGAASGIDTAAQGTSSQKFLYEPLRPGSKAFRLLALSPSNNPGSPIHGQLIWVDLDALSALGVEKCPFTAMLDDLGDGASQEAIFLHGRQISISIDLFTVLRDLRDSDATVLFWVAAICIDQDNPDEKARQERLKPLIFQKSGCLLVKTDRQAAEKSPILEFGPNTDTMEHLPGWSRPGAPELDRDTYFSMVKPHQEKIMRRLVENSKEQWKGGQPPPDRVAVPVIGPPKANLEKGRGEKIYDPLPTSSSVRFIKLELADPVAPQFDMYSPIHCTLSTQDLDSDPFYDALSYTWGDPRTVYTDQSESLPPKDWAVESFAIYCHGKPFSVTPNLYAALLAIRWRLSMQAIHRGAPRLYMVSDNGNMSEAGKFFNLIWIDQICIDQSNLAERSLQVLLMNRIYRQAKNVLVWLGGEDKLTFPASQAIHSLLMIKPNAARGLQDHQILNPETYKRIEIPEIDMYQWLGLWALLNRSWFQRAWIVQEVSVAKNVIFLVGVLALDFHVMSAINPILTQSGWAGQLKSLADEYFEGTRRFAIIGAKIGDFQTDDFRVYQPQNELRVNINFFNSILYLRASRGITSIFWTQVGERQGPLPLQFLIKMFRLARATDPRDKLYAFIGLSRDAMGDEVINPGQSIVPNYEKPPLVVYTEAMRYFLLSSGSLDALSMKEAESKTTISNLPSWVPDFSVMVQPPLTYDWAPWSAGDSLGTGHTRVLENLKLELHGCKVGTIQEIFLQSKALPFDSNLGNIPNFLRMIPELSDFTIPTMTPTLRRALERMELPLNEPWRTNIPESLKDEGMVKRQTRYEVYWRTLLSNKFRGKYPAPSSCGRTILDICDSTLYSLTILAILIDPNLQTSTEIEIQKVVELVNEATGGWDWDLLKTKIGQMYRTIMAFRGNYSYEDDEPIYPPEFSCIMDEIESAWKRGVYCAGTTRYLSEAMAKWNQSRKHLRRQLEIVSTVKRQCHEMNLFVTAEGHLGKANESVKAGDEVWIMSKGSVPLILREVGSGHYRLIGDAYVHGIMHGEPSLGNNPPDLSTVLLV